MKCADHGNPICVACKVNDVGIARVVAAARRARDRSSNANGECMVVEICDWHDLDEALMWLDCTCPAKCEVHNPESVF